MSRVLNIVLMLAPCSLAMPVGDLLAANMSSFTPTPVHELDNKVEALGRSSFSVGYYKPHYECRGPGMLDQLNAFIDAGKDLILLNQYEERVDQSVYADYHAVAFTCTTSDRPGYRTDATVALIKKETFNLDSSKLAANAITSQLPYLQVASDSGDKMFTKETRSCLYASDSSTRVLGSIPLTMAGSGDRLCLTVGACQPLIVEAVHMRRVLTAAARLHPHRHIFARGFSTSRRLRAEVRRR